MNRWTRRLLYALLAVGTIAVAGITATVGWRPFLGPSVRPLTDRRFEPTPARLERGRYLANGSVPCAMCHSELHLTDAGLQPVEGKNLAGRNWAPDGVPFITAPNITPDPETGVGRWSDDALARAIREGVGLDGHTLFPIMPYEKFRSMTDEDLASIVVYLRSQPPVRNPLPRSAVPFPVNRLINAVPRPITAPVTADLSSVEKRGEYLVTIGVCADCHTPMDDRGARVPGMDFAGGSKFMFEKVPGVYSANITPSPDGIPYYNEDLFIEVIRTGRVRDRKLSPMMPTSFYRNMTDDDLKAIFAFLKTLKPVDHYVDNTLAPTKCARCGLEHGGGEKNKKAG